MSNPLLSGHPELLACPICHAALVERSGRLGCRNCAVKYASEDGVYLVGPPFPVRGASIPPRLQELVGEADRDGWETARQKFAAEVLSGHLRGPKRSRWQALQDKLDGRTWEDLLQDLIDPTRAGWLFLTDLRPTSRVAFLGPSWGAAPLTVARMVGHIVVLDSIVERLQLVALQARSMGLDNCTFVRLIDPLNLPLADGSIDLAVVPGMADWLGTVAGGRQLPGRPGDALLRELRRVLAKDGQVYMGVDNRLGIARPLQGARPAGTRYTLRGFRREARAAGFQSSSAFAPLPFRHKFHQVLDLGRTDRMNFNLDAYRTRGRLTRPLIKVWDALNRGGAIERRLYSYLPSFSAVLSTKAKSDTLAERILQQLGDTGALPPSARLLMHYYVRPKGVAVLVAGKPGLGGAVVRLPLDAQAEATCRRHHRVTSALASDGRIPAPLRQLFPQPLAEGHFEGQAYFAESGCPGEAGRRYYSRPAAEYDRAITNAAEVLRQLRRATEVPVLIDPREFARLVGSWLTELKDLVRADGREALVRIESLLQETLIGRTLPLGWHHGDYDFANILYGARDEVTGILDFEVFEPRGLPLMDLLLLLARRPIRRQGFAFGTLFVRSIFARELPPLETRILARETEILGVDDRLYRALALCCWLDHLRLRRTSWLVRSPSWLDANLHEVVASVRSML